MKTKGPPQVLPIDLTGCSITKKEEDKWSLKFRLKGKTESGVDVTGYWLSFKSVRNLYTISWFFRNKWVVETKGSWTNETFVANPLKLPSKICTCTGNSNKKLSYDDDDLNGLNGPPEARASETVVMLALEERRFEGRGPIPIICESVSLLDKAGCPVAPDSNPVTKLMPKAEQVSSRKSTKVPTTKVALTKGPMTKAPTPRQLSKIVDQMDELARRFALSVYFGSLAEAKSMMSAGFLKENGSSGIKKATGKYWGAAKRFKQWSIVTQLGPYKNAKNPWKATVDESWYRDFMRSTIGVTVTVGKNLLHELNGYLLPDYIHSVTQVRCLARVCSPLFERSDFDFTFAIVDENDDGTLRIDALSIFE